ncbi:MAG: hypothetical protein M5U29_16230 [Anaerolineae bacterium]|nr:hypothetical protein [Anaerolineae bacterium]
MADGVHHPRRPWTLWALGLIVILIGAANLALALDHAWHAGRYRALGVSYPPLLRAALALGWAALLLALGAGLARRKRWARRWLVLALSNYGASGVLWTIAFARADFARQRIAFQAVLVVLLVGAAAWVMRWRRVRAAFEMPGAVSGGGQGGRIAESEPDGDDESQD